MRTKGNQGIVGWGSNLNLKLIGGVNSALTGTRQIGRIVIMKLALNFEFGQAGTMEFILLNNYIMFLRSIVDKGVSNLTHLLKIHIVYILQIKTFLFLRMIDNPH